MAIRKYTIPKLSERSSEPSPARPRKTDAIHQPSVKSVVVVVDNKENHKKHSKIPTRSKKAKDPVKPKATTIASTKRTTASSRDTVVKATRKMAVADKRIPKTVKKKSLTDAEEDELLAENVVDIRLA